MEAVSRGINNYQEHHKLTDARKAQLNTRGQTTEFLPTNQAEDQVLNLLYSSTFTSSPVIFVHYKACKDLCTGLRDYHNLRTHDTQCCSCIHWLFKLLQSRWVCAQHCCSSMAPNTAAVSQTQLSKSSSLSHLTFSILVCREVVT